MQKSYVIYSQRSGFVFTFDIGSSTAEYCDCLDEALRFNSVRVLDVAKVLSKHDHSFVSHIVLEEVASFQCPK